VSTNLNQSILHIIAQVIIMESILQTAKQHALNAARRAPTLAAGLAAEVFLLIAALNVKTIRLAPARIA
jgi:hypothetical protein